MCITGPTALPADCKLRLYEINRMLLITA